MLFTHKVRLVFVLAFSLSYLQSSLAQITSDFAANADGWNCFDVGAGSASAVNWTNTGGNPNGNISFATPSASASVQYYWNAPAKFIGNISASYNQNLTFDLKVSIAGTDNGTGDVVLTNSAMGVSLYHQLATKPSSSSWSSYSVLLNETAGWGYGCPTCSAPSQTQLKQALSNVTSLRIRIKYLFATGAYTGQLDNVVLNTLSSSTPPAITSFSPTSGLPGTTVTITGSNFSATPAQNIVYFGGVLASVTNATATQLTVKSPSKGAYGLISVVNSATGLMATSANGFSPLFNNNNDFGGRIIPSSMSIGNKTTLSMNGTTSNKAGGIDKADFDGDGWVDLVVTNTNNSVLYAYHNLGTGGTVSSGSFSSPITLPSMSGIPAGSPGLSEIHVVDIDSDGKLDIAASATSNGSGLAYFAIFRNTSTVGTISFASPVFFGFPYYFASNMAVADLDGDGRVDLMAATGSSTSVFWISQNFSTPGNIDFGYGISYPIPGSSGQISACDLNNDGKPEVVASGYSTKDFTIYKNTSTPGTITLSQFTFTPSTSTLSSAQFTLSDVDADNRPDIIWSGYGANKLYISKNIFNGSVFDATSFAPEVSITNTLTSPTALSVADMNADGKMDIVSVGYSDMAIFQNIGTAGSITASSFAPSILFEGAANGEAIYAVGPAIADLDGDNKPEVAMAFTNNAVAAANQVVFIYHNESFPAPQITSLSSYYSPYGNTINVIGNHLNVYGDIPQTRTQGQISGSSAVSNSSVTTNIVLGASDNRVGVTLHGLTAFSPLPFSASFNTSRVINAAAFPGSVDYNLSFYTGYDGLVTSDLDDDGKPDIITTDNVGGYSVATILHNGISTGAAITTSSFTTATNNNAILHAKMSDIDGDGKQDILTNGLFLQNASTSGTVTLNAISSPLYNASRIEVNHDFNRDGKQDVAITYGTSQIVVYENLSRKGTLSYTGSFSSLASSPVYIPITGSVTGLTAGDFDGDGFDDIAFGVSVSASVGNLTILQNTGYTGTITSAQFAAPITFPALASPTYIATTDFDGDGKLDLVIGNSGTVTSVSVFLNTSTVGNISFASKLDLPALAGAIDVDVSDLDGDGKMEIITIHQPTFGTGAFSVFKNNSTNGSLSFSPRVDYSLTSVPIDLAVADLNLDSKPDLIILRNGTTATSNKGILTIFENKITTPVITINTQPAFSTYQVCDGATPVITVAASGTTNITYQWQKQNSDLTTYTDLTNTGGYSNVSTASITINSTGNFGAGVYRCKISGDYATTVYSNLVTFGVSPIPAAPSTSDVSSCGPSSFTLSASGATSGEQYMWYGPSGLISGQTSNTYTTPVLSATDFYYVALTDGSCVSPKILINAVISAIPAAPVTTNAALCSPGSLTVNASGGTNGQYRWYTTPTGGTAITGEVNSAYTTPSLSGTTTYYVALSNGTCESTRTALAVTITSVTPPTASDANICSGSPATLTASGGANGQYRWYTSSTGGAAIAGQTNNTYTATVTATTTFYVSIYNGTCESALIPATINVTTVATPAVTDGTFCPGSAATLSATGASNGQYRWYTTASGGSAIAGQVNSTYTTPVLTATTSYYVSIVSGSCESMRVMVSASLATTGCNQPPVITPQPETTSIGGSVTVSLGSIITDPNNNVDLSTLVIITQPVSGAIAAIDVNHNLNINYQGISFSGLDKIIIQVCDLAGACTQKEIDIEVAGTVTVYNAVSPNGDGKNDFLHLEYIESIPATKENRVTIFNRWGDEVFAISDYNNSTRVFAGLSNSGQQLAAGTYFYKITFSSGEKTLTGFLELKY